MALEAEIERISALKARILSTQGQRALVVAFDLSALIKLRIQTSGENSQNAPFAPYTPFTVRDRKKKGYQVGYVDFTQTGQLWASVGPRLVSDGNGLAVVVIESRNQRGKDILTAAQPKRGNILLPSQDEIKFAQDAYIQGLTDLINTL